ncbi:MAG: 4Fe-4S dicluster domain-containing protein [Polyangiaceae bacterium]|nr:4Fe-4S dicluster domain-containing protein [Polyangiaceae bacterium]
MPTISIDKSGCRGCSLCVEICPTEVLALSAEERVATVARSADCIGCTSCEYICPSRCVRVNDTPRQRPLYRIEQDAALVARFMQVAPAVEELSADEVAGATRDVRTRLRALAGSVTETMGRGYKVVGRRAGQLAAEHLPEMYERCEVSEVLGRMSRRFGEAFAFRADTVGAGEQIRIEFDKCALLATAQQEAEGPPDATVCVLFHEYWAGLLGAFLGRSYMVQRSEGSGTCSMELRDRSR